MFYDSIVNKIETSRSRRLSGKINCIPWGMPRLEEFNPGLEQRHYYCCTANQKVGKTQLSDHLFVYHPYEYMKANPEKGIKIKGIYFSLEMSKEVKGIQAICRKLWMDSDKTNRKDIKSMLSKVNTAEGILDEETLSILKSTEYRQYYEDFYDTWTFVSDIKHSYGIKKFVEDYISKRGKWIYKEVDWSDDPIRDRWIPNDPEEYLIVVVDHASLIHPSAAEDKTGRGTWKGIGNLSKYLMELRDNYGITPVLVQQQAQAKEGNDSHKLDRLRPSADGLGDNKLTIRDFNTCLGLFSPWRHQKLFYPDRNGYNIVNFQDHIRFLEIIASREGGAGNMFPLFFDGAVNWFQEMPRLDNKAGIKKIRDYLAHHNLLE